MRIKILKFGGTSVSDGDAVRRVAAIVAADETPRKVVVVSAQGGVTTTLLRALADAAALDAAVTRWRGLAHELGLGADGAGRSRRGPLGRP